LVGDGVDSAEDWLHGGDTATLRKWVRRVERDQGMREGLTTSDREQLKALERENRELKWAN